MTDIDYRSAVGARGVPAVPTFGDGAAPRYRQIADLMRQRIARGQWQPGDRLPTLEALVAEFGVARVTVRQAVEVLSRDGLVSAQQGRGTFVTALPPRTQWLQVQTSLEALSRVVHETEVLPLAEERSVQAPVTPEDGAPVASYVLLRRVHSHGRQPYCVINIYLDETIFRRRAARYRREPVIPQLVQHEPDAIAQARQVLTLGAADLEVARLLRVPAAAPVAIVRRVFTDAQGRVIYLGEVTYRGDFVRVEMDLQP